MAHLRFWFLGLPAKTQLGAGLLGFVCSVLFPTSLRACVCARRAPDLSRDLPAFLERRDLAVRLDMD